MNPGSSLPVDMVFTYVDGNDPGYAAARTRYRQECSNPSPENIAFDAGDRDIRFRNVGEIVYSVNSALKYLPWIRTIFLVTETQNPPLAPHLLESGRIRIIHPEEFIPPRYLPTFSSNVIESFLFRIEGISEIFLYNNDDYMHFAPIPPDFFYTMDQGTAALELHAYPAFYRWVLCRLASLSRRYRTNLHTFMIANTYDLLRKACCGFSRRDILVPVHATKIWRTATALKVEEEFGDILEATRLRKFRNADDLSYYTILYSMENKLNPRNHLHRHWMGSMRAPNAMYNFSAISMFGNKRMLWHRILQSQARLACLNDIPFDERERFVEVMRKKGLADPAVEQAPAFSTCEGSMSAEPDDIA
jgi:hypothetical protein